jgi:hypothetical protein
VELGEDCGVLEVGKSGHVAFNGERVGHGRLSAAKRVASNPVLAEQLEAACRATFQGVSTIPDEVAEPAPETKRSARNPKAKEKKR